MSFKDFAYRMFYAPSAYTIDKAAQLGCNWVIAHSFGLVDEGNLRDRDMYPIYFEDYPKVAQVRHNRDAAWLEPMREEIAALCDRADAQGLKVAFHSYEPVLPRIFEAECPELVGVLKRPTQGGTVDMHSYMDPDNPAVWELIRSKYAEIARDFPKLGMVILTTWDGSGIYWCMAKAKLPIAQRLARLVLAAREGVQSVRKDVQVVFRLWGRNWPRGIYMDGHRLIGELTGLPNAAELMQPVCRPYNDPDAILPAVFAALPPDVPIMYKSTRLDICEAQELSLAAGTYPKERQQIIEVSYEQYHKKSWPWCMVQHIRRGLGAARQHKLSGWLALPANMGNDDRNHNPEQGNLGRMNTWLLAELLADDSRGDETLVMAWLAKEFGAPQPIEAARALLAANELSAVGIHWDRTPNRVPFASLHTAKLYWNFDGFADPAFPYRMAEARKETLERLMAQKAQAQRRARRHIQAVKAARAAMSPALYEELWAGLTMLADAILLCRDWHSYLLMQYGIERGVYAPDRLNLGRMSRYAEQFIANLTGLRDTPAGKWAMARLAMPDEFPLT